jgi:cation transport ATPase
MSLSELRKELKDLRKSAMPTPVSRMKKTDCVREIERLKGIHHAEVKKVEEVMKKEEVPKPVAKKVKAVQEVAHSKAEEAVKKTKGVKTPKAEEPKKEEKSSKPAKGSEEMKARMAALRSKRAEKKSE